jgi:hypothetical protein
VDLRSRFEALSCFTGKPPAIWGLPFEIFSFHALSCSAPLKSSHWVACTARPSTFSELPLGAMRTVIQSRHNVRIPILKKYNSLVTEQGHAVIRTPTHFPPPCHVQLHNPFRIPKVVSPPGGWHTICALESQRHTRKRHGIGKTSRCADQDLVSRSSVMMTVHFRRCAMNDRI